MHRGSCLCGAVRLEVRGDLPAPDACHCSQCRKASGHYFVSTDVQRDAVTVDGAENVSWYQQRPELRRGFCKVCGSTLFWDPVRRDVLAIAMGVFDTPTGTRMAIHVHVAEKGDYYELADGLPQRE